MLSIFGRPHPRMAPRQIYGYLAFAIGGEIGCEAGR
jgi:hypothetical protein